MRIRPCHYIPDTRSFEIRFEMELATSEPAPPGQEAAQRAATMSSGSTFAINFISAISTKFNNKLIILKKDVSAVAAEKSW